MCLRHFERGRFLESRYLSVCPQPVFVDRRRSTRGKPDSKDASSALTSRCPTASHRLYHWYITDASQACSQWARPILCAVYSRFHHGAQPPPASQARHFADKDTIACVEGGTNTEMLLRELWYPLGWHDQSDRDTMFEWQVPSRCSAKHAMRLRNPLELYEAHDEHLFISLFYPRVLCGLWWFPKRPGSSIRLIEALEAYQALAARVHELCDRMEAPRLPRHPEKWRAKHS